VSTLLHDLRLAFRRLRTSPGFTFTALIIIALGIGANTAIFTLVHSIMLKSLPVGDPAKIYRIGTADNCCVYGGLQDHWGLFSYALYQDLRDHTAAIEELSASESYRTMLAVRRTGTREPAQSFRSEFVSGNYFKVFGLNPYVGRLFTNSDDVKGAAPVAVISNRAWQQKYASDGSVVGATFVLNGVPATIIGVAPPGFFGERLQGDPPDFWMPLSLEPVLLRDNSLLDHSELSWLYLFGRLAPNAQPTQLSAQLTTELQQWLVAQGNVAERQKADIGKQKIDIGPGGAGITSLQESVWPGLRLLMAASGVVLLIACANLANLLLARGMARKMQTSIRLALGASRTRLIRETLVESLLLSLVGGAAGIVLSHIAARAIVVATFRGNAFIPIDTQPSLPVLGFAIALSLLTGVVFGVAPAWITSHSDPAETMRGQSRSVTDRSAFPQRALIVFQAAISVVLLAVAGFLTMSLRNLQNQQLGYEKEGRLLLEVDPLAAGYTPERLLPLYQQLQERMSAIPGVKSSTLALYTPPENNNWGEHVWAPGISDNTTRQSSWVRVAPRYFETIGTKLLQGRAIDDRDTPTSQPIAVVNQIFGKQIFGTTDVIGKHFGKGDASHAGDYEIVGIVEDTKYRDPSSPAKPMFFVPMAQVIKTYKDPGDSSGEIRSLYINSIVLHVAGDPNSYAEIAKATLANVDPNLTAHHVHSYSEMVSINLSQDALLSRLTSLFGGLAVLLACIGLYGVTAYRIARRTGEIGIRMALGANRKDVLALVLRSAFTQVGLGLVIGVPFIFVAGHFLASQLFGVKPYNLAIVLGSVGVLATAAAIATLIPARRAAWIEPMKALRTE
jgi:predicted permease